MRKTKEQKNERKKVNHKDGITIISLVITVVLMLILTSVIVKVSINGGLFQSASDAVDSTEVADEKSKVQEAFIWAKAKSKTGKVTIDDLQKSIPTYLNATVIDNGDTLVVKFNESNRYYKIANNGKVEYLGKLKEKAVTLECVDSTGKVLASKNITLLWEKYSITPPQIEGYEPSVEKLTGEIEESGKIQALYYKLFQDDTTLVFTGLDSSGNVTTDEASIVSYMVGDGTNTNGNGLLEKTVLGILKIPDSYKGKPVTQIGANSFYTCKNIIKLLTGDSVSVINKAFLYCYGLEEIVIGKNIEFVSGGTFSYCNNIKIVTITTENDGMVFNWFEGNSNFTEIKVNSGNQTYKVEDNILYSIDGKILYRIPCGRTGTLTIPDGVETIAKQAGNFGNIEKLVISDTVKTIQNGAFVYNNKLEEVILGRNIEIVQDHGFGYDKKLKTLIVNCENTDIEFGRMFTGCNIFTEIKVNSDNKTYKVEDNILYSIDGTILYLVPTGRNGTLTIPEGVETIYDVASMSSIINKVVISKSVQTMKWRSFASCGSLEEIIIAENVENIGTAAFSNSNKLKTVIIDSATIAEKITAQNSWGGLVNVAETIYIKEGITAGSYITDTTIFKVETSDKEGYVKYVKI